MNPLFWLFVSSFVFVFLRAFQQQNVIHGKWAWVLPVSYMLCAAEYYIISLAANAGYGFTIVLVGGTGAGLGCLCSMLFHRYLVARTTVRVGVKIDIDEGRFDDSTVTIKELGKPPVVVPLRKEDRPL